MSKSFELGFKSSRDENSQTAVEFVFRMEVPDSSKGPECLADWAGARGEMRSVTSGDKHPAIIIAFPKNGPICIGTTMDAKVQVAYLFDGNVQPVRQELLAGVLHGDREVHRDFLVTTHRRLPTKN